MIPAAHHSTFKKTSTSDDSDDRTGSMKADRGSHSFLEALSPWSTKSHAVSDAAAEANSTYLESLVDKKSGDLGRRSQQQEAKDCSALVEEVFRPHAQQKAETTGEVAFLPRLLSRVNFSMWSQASPKNLNSEIQSLRGQQHAASKLLEGIERETEHINQQLKEKTQQAKLQPGNKGFFGLACTHCGPSSDANEINLQTVHLLAEDAVELRPMLRGRVRECEEALVERDAELRQLRHEIQLLRSEKEMIRQAEKDAVLDGAVNAKTALVQRYGAAFSLVEGSHLKVAFLAWRQLVQRRALRAKMLKRVTLAFASDSSRLKALVFASWQTLVRDKREAAKLKKDRQRLAIGQSYAAKFVMQADSTTMRAIVVEWWRVSKESSLRAHVAAAQAKQDAGAKALMPHASTQKQTDKACCTLM